MSEEKLAEALAWIAEGRGGYRQAARKFKVSAADLKALRRGGQTQGSRVSREEVLAWMESTGQGRVEAARQFGIPEGTVAAWVARRPKAGGEGEEEVDPGESRRDFLVRSLGELRAAKRKATPGQLAGLMKQEATFHEELVQLEEAARLQAGEFADPREMIEHILSGLEMGAPLLTTDDLERLEAVVSRVRRLTAAERAEPITTPQLPEGGPHP